MSATALVVDVKIADSDVFHEFIGIVSEAMNDDRIPESVRKENVERFVKVGVSPE